MTKKPQPLTPEEALEIIEDESTEWTLVERPEQVDDGTADRR